MQIHYFTLIFILVLAGGLGRFVHYILPARFGFWSQALSVLATFGAFLWLLGAFDIEIEKNLLRNLSATLAAGLIALALYENLPQKRIWGELVWAGAFIGLMFFFLRFLEKVW